MNTSTARVVALGARPAAASPAVTPAKPGGRRPSTWQRLRHSYALGWLFVLCLMAVWEVVARAYPAPNFPPLSRLAQHGWQVVLSGALPQALAETLARMAGGYALAAVFGIAVGLLIGGSRFFRVLLEPLIEMTRPVPISAFVPLLILLLGIGDGMKVWVAFAGASFPIILNTQAGVASVPLTLRETAATFRLTSLQRTREITLPWAAPSIFVGLRLALATALIVSVIAEMIAGNSGIGFYILQGQQTLAVQEMYVGIFALGLTGCALNTGFVTLERRLLHWHASALRAA